MPGVNEFTIQAILNRVFDSANNRLNVSIGAANQTINDDIAIYFGTDNDIAVFNRSTSAPADSEITGQIVGTSVHRALAANTLVVSNITANGDVSFMVNNGGNSLEAVFIDASALIIYLGYGAFTEVFYSAANSTNNTGFTVENTSNAAAASHAYISVTVGGTTSTGDPQLRLTIPGGTSWYIGVDNNGNDNFYIGTGTAVGASGVHLLKFDSRTSYAGDTGVFDIQPATITLGNSASDNAPWIRLLGFSLVMSSTTTVTGLMSGLSIANRGVTQTGGAITIDKAAGVSAESLSAGTSVTITHNSAFRALTVGAAVNASGIFLEAQTAGTTRNVQLLMAIGSTEPTAAPTDTAGIYAIDVGAASVLGFVEETAVVTPAGDFTLTSKWIVRINGTTYAIGMTTVLT